MPAGLAWMRSGRQCVRLYARGRRCMNPLFAISDEHQKVQAQYVFTLFPQVQMTNGPFTHSVDTEHIHHVWWMYKSNIHSFRVHIWSPATPEGISVTLAVKCSTAVCLPDISELLLPFGAGPTVSFQLLWWKLLLSDAGSHEVDESRETDAANTDMGFAHRDDELNNFS